MYYVFATAVLVMFYGILLVFCFQNCSDHLGEKKCSSDHDFFWNSQPSSSNLPNVCDHYNNSFEQWKVTTIFKTEGFFTCP